jgi:hypothetical protein
MTDRPTVHILYMYQRRQRERWLLPSAYDALAQGIWIPTKPRTDIK